MIYQLKVIHSVARVHGEEISEKYKCYESSPNVVSSGHYLQVWVLAQ